MNTNLDNTFLEPEFISDVLELLANPGSIACETFQLPVVDYSKMHFWNNSKGTTRSETFTAYVVDQSESETVILSVPEYYAIAAENTVHFKLAPLLPVPCPPILSLDSFNEITRSLVKRQSCVAKKIASSRRDRIGGQFKKCKTKWISATDFFLEKSLPSSSLSNEVGNSITISP
mmetsp:Transcript_3218/g.4859  ORF Transcript_3218/g.4859 Transcript_3218/m.4859 type:complete len:175 (+) Transcript_3218:1798-2322(+)